MIYLDNGAGSWPKPYRVGQAMQRALDRYGANPGRGSYALTRATADMVEGVRGQLATLINAADPKRIAFTPGATYSLNIAIHGLLRPGDHAICSGVEHNAVYRPLAALAAAGVIELTVVAGDSWGYITAAQVAEALRPNTRLVAISHACNVCGSVQPLAEICRAAHTQNTLVLADAAQSGGLLELDVEELGVDLLALAGHKALYGPAGVGALWLREGVDIEPLIYGGTGSQSELPTQPPNYPDRLEAGSLNTIGIAGWGAALTQVESAGIDELYRHAMGLTNRLEQRLRELPGLIIHVKPDEQRPRVPVLSVVVPDQEASDIATLLDAEGLCVRAGYHCAPLAHRCLGSFETGSIRFSPGWFNTKADIEQATLIMRRVLLGLS